MSLLKRKEGLLIFLEGLLTPQLEKTKTIANSTKQKYQFMFYFQLKHHALSNKTFIE